MNRTALQKVIKAQAAPPAPPQRKRRTMLGVEYFDRAAGPWGMLLAPVPLAGLLIIALRATFMPVSAWPWLAGRLDEIGWLLFAPFFFAAVGIGVAQLVSRILWVKSKGEKQLDYAAHAWHFHVGIALALLPLLLLQVSPGFLDFYMMMQLKVRGLFASAPNLHVGYDPDLSNLMIAGVLPLVLRQVNRLMYAVPCGRLVGFQRELSRLRGTVAWDAEAWTMLVGDCFDRWLSDIRPPEIEAAGAERHRLQRRRWGLLRREVIASFQKKPADLSRANEALIAYRQSL